MGMLLTGGIRPQRHDRLTTQGDELVQRALEPWQPAHQLLLAGLVATGWLIGPDTVAALFLGRQTSEAPPLEHLAHVIDLVAQGGHADTECDLERLPLE